MPGLDRVHTCAALAPVYRFRLNANVVGTLVRDVGTYGMRNRLAAQERQLQELFGRCKGEGMVLFR